MPVRWSPADAVWASSAIISWAQWAPRNHLIVTHEVINVGRLRPPRSHPFAHNQDPERTYRDHCFQRRKKALSTRREIVNQTPAAAFISPASSS
jgi:hypothetical protein